MKNLIEINLEKSRSGVYKDTPENRRLHRVGQRYGSPGREEDPAAAPLNNRRGGSIVNRSGGFVGGSAERTTNELFKKYKEEVEHHQQELDNLEAKKEQYVKQNGQSKYDERKKKIEDALNRAKTAATNAQALIDSRGEGSSAAGEESYTRVNLADIPNAHKVNLKKYLSAKRKKAVDDAWDKAKFDSVSREKAGVFQEGYNKLREQFNNNFDDMSKAERAELLYKILKMKNAMEKK